MKIATALSAFLLGIWSTAPAQEGSARPASFNLKAISAHERPRYNDLMKRLRRSVRGRSALNDGHLYTLEGNAITLLQVAERMRLELRWCPFLTLQVSAAGTQTDWLLTLTSPAGTKALLEIEFPAH